MEYIDNGILWLPCFPFTRNRHIEQNKRNPTVRANSSLANTIVSFCEPNPLILRWPRQNNRSFVWVLRSLSDPRWPWCLDNSSGNLVRIYGGNELGTSWRQGGWHLWLARTCGVLVLYITLLTLTVSTFDTKLYLWHENK